jgi:hypothetical protein
MRYQLEIQHGYLVTKDPKNQVKVHNTHFVLDPVTKAVCLVSGKNSDIVNHIRANHMVSISYYNPKSKKYNRIKGIAATSLNMLCDFEKEAFQTLNPQSKKTEVLIYIETDKFEVLSANTTASQLQHIAI